MIMIMGIGLIKMKEKEIERGEGVIYIKKAIHI